MMMDHTNFLGRGNTALYITGYRPIYYVFIASSFQKWMEQHIWMLENEYYLISEHEGDITSWFNISKIYE